MLISWPKAVRLALAAASVMLLGGAAAAETITLRSGDNLAEKVLEAADGDVIRLEPGRYAGPVQVAGKRIVIEGAPGAVIVPGEGEALMVVREGGRVELSDLVFETTSDTSRRALLAEGGSIRCSGCMIEGAPFEPVRVDEGSLELVRSRITGASEYLVVVRSSDLSIEDTEIEVTKGTALRVVRAKKVDIRHSRIIGAAAAAVYGKAAQIRIVDSEFVAQTDYAAMYLEIAGSAEIERTRFGSKGHAFVANLEAGTTMRMSAVEARGLDWGIYFDHWGGEKVSHVTLDDVRVAAGKGVALRAVDRIDLIGKDSIFVSRRNAAVIADGKDVRVRLEKSVMAAERDPVPVLVGQKESGKIEVVDCVMFPEKKFDPGVLPDNDTRRMARAITDDAALAEELKAGSTEFLNGGTSDRLERAAARVRAMAPTITMVSLDMTDGAGRSRPAPFNVVGADSLEVVAQSGDGAPVPVPAGRYFVEFSEDAALAAELEVKGGSATARVEVPEALWLDANLTADEPSRFTLFRPIAADKVREVFRASVILDYAHPNYYARTFRRPEATDADVAAALDAARRHISIRMALVRPDAEGDEFDRFTAWWTGIEKALEILASAGTADDAARIAAIVDPGHALGAERPLIHLAYLEHRLGLLANGRVAAFADGPDPNIAVAALALLDFYGVAGAKERLFALASDERRFAALSANVREDVAQRLIGLDDPRIADIAAAALRRALEDNEAASPNPDLYHRFLEHLTVSFAAHLMVFGTVEQKASVAEAFNQGLGNLKFSLATVLSSIAVNPRPFVEESQNEWGTITGLHTTSCVNWRLRGAAEFAPLYDMMVDAYAQSRKEYRVRNSKSYVNERQAYASAAAYARFRLSGCRPSREAASAYYNGQMKNEPPGDWFAVYSTVEELKEVLRESFYHTPLEAAPVDVAVAAWRQFDHVFWTSFRDELIAMFRAFTKAGDSEINSIVDDGVERRVYVLRRVLPEEAYTGAINGHLEVRPIAEDGKLEIGVRLTQAAWYNSFGGLADMIATGGDRNHWAHHAYVVDGRKLIERIELFRDGQSISLTEKEAPDAEGYFRFSTGLAADDLSGLVLDVDLALFDDRRSFQFDLFASRLARGVQ